MEENIILDVATIDNSLDLFKGAGNMLLDHRNRAAKSVEVGNKILSEWEAADKIEDPEQRFLKYAEIDGKTNNHLVKLKGTKQIFFDSRKALTDLMDEIKTAFTTEENIMDPAKSEVPKKLQGRRDKYVQDKKKWEEQVRLEAERKKNKEIEKGEIQSQHNLFIGQWLLNVLSGKKTSVTETFNKITLPEFEAKKEGLKNMPVIFDKNRLSEMKIPGYQARYHDATEVEAIRKIAFQNYDFDSFYNQYTSDLITLKQQLIDRLPSKKAELDEAERLRLEHEENERKRKEELEKANEKRKKELEEQQKLQREQEEQQRQKQEQERLQREQEERDRQAKEQEENEQKLKDDAERQRLANEVAALFQESTDVSVTAQAPAMREGYNIVVLHHAGWVEIFTYWYKNAGIKEELDDMPKKTLKQMKTFCEKAAIDKDGVPGTKIVSQHLKYDEVFKAINKKEKPKTENGSNTNQG